MFQEVGGVRGVGGGIKPRRAVLSPGHCRGEPPCLGCRGGGAVGGVGSGGVRWGGVGSSSWCCTYQTASVCVAGCIGATPPNVGGSYWGCWDCAAASRRDCPHGLASHTHSCIHTQPHTHIRAHTTTTRTDTTDKDRTDKRGERQKRPQRIVGKGVHERGRRGEERVEKRRERREAGHKRRKINRSS